MAWFAFLFAILAIIGLGVAIMTGSRRALFIGLADWAVGIVHFCIWVRSL